MTTLEDTIRVYEEKLEKAKREHSLWVESMTSKINKLKKRLEQQRKKDSK